MRTAYIDCSAGAAGDMLLGALVDAGAAQEDVRHALDSLDLQGWDLRFEEAERAGLGALHAIVEVTRDHSPRGYGDIVGLIEKAQLDPATAALSHKAFAVLAHAEARVHGIPVDQVHFHETGAVDAIIDIVGCCAAVTSLAFETIIVSAIATGAGTVRAAHGELPLPAPAVVEILRGTNATLFGRGTRELVTPTGAALLVAMASRFGDMPPMRIEAVGSGAGTANLEFPNIVRVIAGTSVPETAQPTSEVLVETNLDDMSPELLPHVIETLLGAGAQDAWITPIVMKKGRPAFTVAALCDRSLEETIVGVLFRETTTLGTRTTSVAKRALAREWVDTEIAGATVRVKVGHYDGEVATLAPEHEDALAVARTSGLPLKQVYSAATEEARRKLAAR